MKVLKQVRYILGVLAVICVLFANEQAFALGQRKYIAAVPQPHGFTIAEAGKTADIVTDDTDYPGVVRAARDLQSDIAKVTGVTPAMHGAEVRGTPSIILAGTIGKSRMIDSLIAAKKIDVTGVAGKWESFLIQVVRNPMPGVAKAMVIAGSDKRGTIYGIYDVSEQIGVSPWYWWADVPAPHKDALYVKTGRHVEGEPAVKYRGIFLNDEAPALTGWVKEKFGNYNSKFYTKVFELILRMKGNYLWPAMWDNAFNEDDPLNPKLADEYGIVMGTSHHEPMLRAQQEWKRHGKGPWDYSKNGEVLRNFWAEGVARNKNYESITTIGMRGDGDEPMSESANIALLERIVADQRKILAERVNPDVTKIPQLWALYKEVQEYYEKGMRVPDDVTLLWCDDNWGNIRRLPTAAERKRSGGAGVYYHFDYVGGPRNYKWLNTNPIAKVWEQMNLADHYDARRIWIVNVGDLKPMEFPIEFFLSLAWNPRRWPKEKISEFTRLWAEREFGPEHANEIADIMAKYTKYNGRRKPELLEPETFSLVNYQEADRVVADWKAITARADAIYQKLPAEKRDAFYELVLYPTKASAIVTEMYVAAGKNRLYAAQGRASANECAARMRELFKADAELANQYNHELAGGKWNHMMDQTHIGYTYWQQPPENKMPEVKEVEVPARAEMGVAVEGSTVAWLGTSSNAVLPEFDVFNRQRHYIDVFNHGSKTFEFTATSSEPWIVLSEQRGTVEREDRRLWVSIDWTKAPVGKTNGAVTISHGSSSVVVLVAAFKPQMPTSMTVEGFVEGDGYVAVEAPHYTSKVDTANARWDVIEDHGRTSSSMTVFPVTADSVKPPANSPRLEYKMYLFHAGEVRVETTVAPTLNFVPGGGLRYAVSFDDEVPQIVDVLANDSLKKWEESVKDAVRRGVSTHRLSAPGYHTLKVWMVDPAVVLERVLVDTGGGKPCYLGPPESFRRVVGR